MTTITQADYEATVEDYIAAWALLREVSPGGCFDAHNGAKAFAEHREAAEARAAKYWYRQGRDDENQHARLEGAKAMQDVAPALDQLRNHQRQADMDGVFVTVSRQALDEVLDAIAALDPEQIAGGGK